MEKRVLFTELDDRGSHLRKEITPTAVVTDNGKFPAGMFWDANKTMNTIVAGATSASDTLEKAENNLNAEITRATQAEQDISDRIDDILGIDAQDIEDLKTMIEDLDSETGILSVIDSKASKEEVDLLKEDISVEVSITTNADANGHEYVDLGLPSGTLWAKMNVGANSLTDYGYYYKYGKGSNQYDDLDEYYNGQENPLPPSVDTASLVWAGDWHIPTKDQFDELIANTTYLWTTISGIYGGKFTAQNGNYIFLPASGLWSYGSLSGVDSNGNYLTSTPSTSAWLAYTLFFNSDNKNIGENSRNYGCSVRPVLPGYVETTTVLLGKTATDEEKALWNTVSDKANTSDLGTAATKDVPTSGNASNTEVVMGNDSRLTDARTPVSHTHTKSEITDFPTNVSSFTNDAGYLTQHQSLTDYVQKSQTAGLLKNDGTVDTNTYSTLRIWTGTQAQYDLIDPIDPTTIYIIK